jgi:hypothetical protein
MTELRSSRNSWMIVILCLCFGSLVILPVFSVVNLATPEMVGGETDNHSLLDPAELEDDLLVAAINSTLIADPFISKSGPTNLDFQAAFYSPVPPPPRRS